MTDLNFLEALKAIRECARNQYFMVGLITQTMAEAKCAHTDMIDAIRDDPEELDLVKSIRPTEIVFKNGSTIKCMSASANMRGYKFDRVLCSENIALDIWPDIVNAIKLDVADTEMRGENHE